MIIKNLVICGLFLFYALSLLGQNKNDTKIIVEAKDTVNLFNRIALALYDADYSLEEKDPSVGFMLTKEKFERKVVGSRKIKVLIKGNLVEFSGLCRLELSALEREKGRFDPVYYRGMKGNLYMVTWEEMLSIGKQFGDKISYSK